LPTTPIASAATKAAAWVAEQRCAGLVGDEGEHRCRTHHERVSRPSAEREREREPGRDRDQQLPATERRLRGDLADRAEPVHGDRPTDLDAEDETEKLDERARRVGDAGLEMLGRELSHPDRERHAWEDRHECGKRDEIGRRVEAELRKRRRAEAGSDPRDRGPSLARRARSAARLLRVLVDRRGAEQRQPKSRHALQEPLELRLITDATDQDRLPPLACESHALECIARTVAELTFDRESVHPICHASSIARNVPRAGET
jgi:hypothetical protein